MTLLIAAIFVAIGAALPSSAPAALRALVDYQAIVNLAILAFNLLPAFPLDGGRVARALLWGRIGEVERATAIAATIGRAFGFAMIALGIAGALLGAFGGIWLALIGLFVIAAAKAEERGLHVRVALTGREAGLLMSAPAIAIPADVDVAAAVEDYFVRYRHTAFPVVGGDGLVGLVDLETVERVPRRDGPRLSWARSRSTIPRSLSTGTRTWQSCSSAPRSNGLAGRS